MTSAPAIGFEYRPSRGFRRLVMLVAALAVIAVSLSALTVWLKLILCVVVLGAAARSVRRMANSPVAAVGWNADDAWIIHLASHDDVPATLASFRVLGALVLLRLKNPEHGIHVLLLAPDNSDADIRRRLRMRLATLQAEPVPTRAGT
jgi:toxin CptA